MEKQIKGLTERQIDVIIVLLLVSAILVVFWQVQYQEFVFYDDATYVTQNAHVRQGLTWASVKYAFIESRIGYWQPLTWLSLMTDRQIFLNNAGGYHWTNLILHIANTIILFLALMSLTKARWQSAFVAALFALHPLHVEPVACISSRKDVLSGFFWMTAMWAYAYYVAVPSLQRYLLLVASFILGMMAKPMIATLPVVLLLLDFWPLKRFCQPDKIPLHTELSCWKRFFSLPFVSLILEKIPLFAVVFAVGLISVLLEGKTVLLSPLDTMPLYARAIMVIVAYFTYLEKIFYPVNLAAYYPLPTLIPFSKIILSVTVLSVVSVFVFVKRKSSPFLAVGWLWFLATLLPVIGLITVYSHAIADRYTYIPIIGIFIMISYAAPQILPSFAWRRPILFALAAMLILTMMIMSWRQTSYWQNSITLWEHALQVTADNPDARNNLGAAMTSVGRLAEAEEHLRQAIRMDANSSSNNNLGIVLWQQGKHDEAYRQLLKVVTLQPDFANARNSLGAYLNSRGKNTEALKQFLEAIRLEPDNAQFHFNAGLVYLVQGNYLQAQRYFKKCLILDGSYKRAEEQLRLVESKMKTSSAGHDRSGSEAKK